MPRLIRAGSTGPGKRTILTSSSETSKPRPRLYAIVSDKDATWPAMLTKYLRKPLSSTASWDGIDWLPTRNRTGPHSVRISTDWPATTTWRGVGTPGQARVETPGREGVGTPGLAGVLERAV